jgi:hypothetical protein
MFLFNSFLKSGRSPLKEACEGIGQDFPALMRHAIVAGIPVPGSIRWLGGYAMCLNHWLPFLPVPVILLNANWFADCEMFTLRYMHDVKTGYHPGCGCPFRYVMAHELAHFIYLRMKPDDRKMWESRFEPGKPSGYSTTAEESFCESLAGGIHGLEGKHFELAAALARDRCEGSS